MSAIERCRTAALGGHVSRCEDCGHEVIAYSSCRNRHCPKCQGAAAKQWLAEREAELLPVPYYHLVLTLPAPIADIAYQNKAVIYDLLFKASAETLIAIAADPKHLGAKIGLTAVLHTWGSALTHHPHVHVIVPGAAAAFLSMPLLWRPHDRHRDLRARLRADGTNPRRHVMTPVHKSRCAGARCSSLSIGDDDARRELRKCPPPSCAITFDTRHPGATAPSFTIARRSRSRPTLSSAAPAAVKSP